MKTILTLSFLLFNIGSSFANCDEFFNEKAQQMQLGPTTNPVCGIKKSEDENGLRISLSTLTGRKDTGPTLRIKKYIEEEEVKVYQLLSKDPLTSHQQKFTYTFNQNCEKIKSITYLFGTINSEINYEKCQKVHSSFSSEELIRMGIVKICKMFFPKEKVKSDSKRPTSSAIEN